MRVKNVRNILLKNAIDACVATLAWWAVGNSFAQGECGQNGFIGEGPGLPHNWLAELAAGRQASRIQLWVLWQDGLDQCSVQEAPATP